MVRTSQQPIVARAVSGHVAPPVPDVGERVDAVILEAIGAPPAWPGDPWAGGRAHRGGNIDVGCSIVDRRKRTT